MGAPVVRFFAIYDYNSMEKIGEIKKDTFRTRCPDCGSVRPWTALGKDGRRIKDCHTREEAEDAIRETINQEKT